LPSNKQARGAPKYLSNKLTTERQASKKPSAHQLNPSAHHPCLATAKFIF